MGTVNNTSAWFNHLSFTLMKGTGLMIIIPNTQQSITLQWRHNERDGVSNCQRLDCLFSDLFTLRSKKTPKHRVTGLCEGNSPVTGEFPAQMASNAENVPIRWRHHKKCLTFHTKMISRQTTGVRLNKKDSLTRYGNSHVKDKTS